MYAPVHLSRQSSLRDTECKHSTRVGSGVDWPELEMLRNDLAGAVRRGGLPPQAVDEPEMMEADRLARITLADVDHVRQWERMHPSQRSGERRRQELGDAMRRLLALLEP
jgi:hypothetical protein